MINYSQIEDDMMERFVTVAQARGRDSAYNDIVAYMEETLGLEEETWHAIATYCYHNADVAEEE